MRESKILMESFVEVFLCKRSNGRMNADKSEVIVLGGEDGLVC